MRRGTEDKCHSTGYVFCFQTLKSGERRYYWCNSPCVFSLCVIHLVTLSQMCTLTFILSYTEAAFSGSLLWCLKANSVSTIPGDIHCREGKQLEMYCLLFTHWYIHRQNILYVESEQHRLNKNLHITNLLWLWCGCLLREALAVSPQSKQSQRI